MIVFPDSHLARHREVLFVRETNDHIAVWEGAKLNKAQATSVSGIATVYWSQDFTRILHQLIAECACLYLNSNEHTRAHRSEVQTRQDRLNAGLRQKYPNYVFERSAPIMHRIRSVKSGEEIEQMQKACDITKAGFERVLKFVEPGVMEYAIEARVRPRVFNPAGSTPDLRTYADYRERIQRLCVALH